MSTLINVITRTSNRPNAFDRNYNSVKSQTYKNINHIVIYDNPQDYENYVSKYSDITVFAVDREELIKNYKGPTFTNRLFWPSYHNLYFNPVLKTIDEGWIIFLDDDDLFFDENSVQKIINNLQNEDTLYIWKMLSGGHTVIPRQITFNMKKLELGNIGSNCFTFHSKWAKQYEWDGFKCGDFRFVQSLSKTIPNQEWIDQILVLVPSAGFGRRVDN